jgi:long-chain fatty acid transport protein
MLARSKHTGVSIRVALSLMILLAVTSPIQATNGMKAIGVGPAQRSMGGVGVALPLDSGVTVTNPAGMADLGRRLDVGATYFSPDVGYRAHSTAGMVTHDDAFISSDRGPCVMPALGFIMPLNAAWSFGLGIYGVCGMGVDYPSNLYHNVTYTEYGLLQIAPALSWRLNSKTSIGAALDLGYATMEFNAGSPLEQPHKDGEAFGIGATFGIRHQLTKDISVALAYGTKQSFSDFKFSTASGTDKLRLDQPQSATLGWSVRPMKPLRVAFDLSWIDWPQTMGKNLPAYTQNRSGATPWNMSWDEQWVYKLGLEYDLSKTTKVRLGYNYGRNPLDSGRAFENIAFPAVVEHHFTAGLSVAVTRQVSWNLGAMVAPKESLDTANVGQYIDRAKTEMSQYSIEMGASYLF